MISSHTCRQDSREKGIGIATTTAQSFYSKRVWVASGYLPKDHLSTQRKTMSQIHLTGSSRPLPPLLSECVARASRFLNRSLEPQRAIPISARNGVQAARLNKPQSLKRESNFLRYSVL